MPQNALEHVSETISRKVNLAWDRVAEPESSTFRSLQDERNGVPPRHAAFANEGSRDEEHRRDAQVLEDRERDLVVVEVAIVERNQNVTGFPDGSFWLRDQAEGLREAHWIELAADEFHLHPELLGTGGEYRGVVGGRFAVPDAMIVEDEEAWTGRNPHEQRADADVVEEAR